LLDEPFEDRALQMNAQDRSPGKDECLPLKKVQKRTGYLAILDRTYNKKSKQAN